MQHLLSYLLNKILIKWQERNIDFTYRTIKKFDRSKIKWKK